MSRWTSPSRIRPTTCGSGTWDTGTTGKSATTSTGAIRGSRNWRACCVAARGARGEDAAGPLTDLWGDVHRLKHNSRRVNHPCQLPPLLMRRLIALFTVPGELVLDPFNGAGTTTLAATQLGRRYLG